MKLFSKVLIGLCLASLPAFCASISISSLDTWYGFYWNQTGGQVFGNENNFTGESGTLVTATSPVGGPDVSTWNIVVPIGESWILTVTDMYTSGDTFNIFDDTGSGSTLLSGTVNPPSNPGTQCGTLGNDPLTCLANSNFYHGTFTLNAGTNAITIYDVLSAPQTFNGSAAFELQGQGDAVVPEPTTLSLMGLGLVGLLLGRRVKRV